MKVRLMIAASRDLRDIGLWIAEHNVPRSITFVEELRDRCRALTDHAERFPEVISVGGSTLRKMSHGNYIILYRVRSTTVEILRVVHASRDWMRVLPAD